MLQEKLYNVGNTNDKKGFSSEISDDFINPKAQGELPNLAEKMGIKVKPLTGYSLNKFNFIELDISTQRKGSVDKFFKANPTGGLINADKKSVKKLSEKEMNDFVYTNDASVLGLSMK